MRTIVSILLVLTLVLTLPVWADGGKSGSGGGQSDDKGGGHGSDDQSGSAGSSSDGSGRNGSDDNSGKCTCQPGCAQDDGARRRARHFFEATSAGMGIDASGYWETRVRGNRQKFKVEIDANVPDGTTYLVLANNMPAGTITIEAGEAELELDTGDGDVLPAGVDPVTGIHTVDVTDSNGEVILHSSI